MQILSHVTKLFLISAFLLQSCASVKEYQYTSDDYLSYKDEYITSVTLKNGDIATYDKGGGRYAYSFQDSVNRHRIVGFDVNGRPISLTLDRVLEVHCEVPPKNSDSAFGGFLLGALAGAAAMFLFILASFSAH